MSWFGLALVLGVLVVGISLAVWFEGRRDERLRNERLRGEE